MIVYYVVMYAIIFYSFMRYIRSHIVKQTKKDHIEFCPYNFTMDSSLTVINLISIESIDGDILIQK